MLGVGPMSKNCVDAVLDIVNTHSFPIMLIASRRQIEAEQLGRGYVNNWSTEEFARYVTDNDHSGNVILVRDHGGPWQNTFETENKFSYRRAMAVAKKSFETDIVSGFDILHIDPSIDIFKTPTVEELLQRVFELYEHCYSFAVKSKKKISFEIGTEEQNGSVQDIDLLEYVICEISKFCKKNKYPQPVFMVAQTGTKVIEMRNIGALDYPLRIDNELPAEIQVPRIVELCNKYGIYLKEHNADYISDETLSWHPKLGIHSANVAPEFGVTETKMLIKILKDSSMQALLEKFLGIAYESKKWVKWTPEGSKVTDYEKSVIAGHYTFAFPEVVELKKKAQRDLKKSGIDLEMTLKEAVKSSIMRYARCFNLIGRWL